MNKSSNRSLFFYRRTKLITVQRGAENRTILREIEGPLAELHTGDIPGAGLLVTDDKGTVLAVEREGDAEPHCYTAYGHNQAFPSRRSVLGFNGEAIEVGSLCYPLGNGYRIYNTRLMRFLSPDNLSPFDQGGLNSYVYGIGDPINHTDPTGHTKIFTYTEPGRQIATSRPRKVPLFRPREVPISLPSRSSEKYFTLQGHRPDGTKMHTTIVKTILSFEQPEVIFIPQDSLPAFRKTQERQRSQMTYVKFEKRPADLPQLVKEIEKLSAEVKRQVDEGAKINQLFGLNKIKWPVEATTQTRT